MDSSESKIDELLDRFKNESKSNLPKIPALGPPGSAPARNLSNLNFNSFEPSKKRPQNLAFAQRFVNTEELDKNDKKLKEIMKNSGKLKINGITYITTLKEMDHIEELGNGTCGHVVKMRHGPSNEIIAVKQMRRTGNNEENKRIVMDIEVVIKSHGCPYIVQCLGCFITEAEVWICMELMSTCFEKLMKRLKQPIPEHILGKVTVATIKALAYLKDNHGIIHRDVKPSNILLDERGNVKLCDFGISGRLVDSMAATKSAGCTAYLAPERIEVNQDSPDYDIRADVWSLGITLVELATGKFPYEDCKTDFEVLTKVIEEDPPSLPANEDFSPEFRNFISCCLIKDQKHRPKYVKLKKEAFYRKYENADVNVGEWFVNTITEGSATRQINKPFRSFHARQRSEPPPNSMFYNNGKEDFLNPPLAPDKHESHLSRLAQFQRDRPPGTCSPFQAYQNHLHAKKQQELFVSPIMQRRNLDRWHSPAGSPLRHQDEPNGPYNSGNTSPIVLQRFYHQQKQQQLQKEAEEYAKAESGLGRKRIASYIKLQLNSDRTRSSRHQSPEPPPRLNRSVVGNQSPLALRRHFFESNPSASTGLSKRYISPTPPVPPPRRLSESISVPGSPQHVRARFHYTPEPQRRLFHSNDVS